MTQASYILRIVTPVRPQETRMFTQSQVSIGREAGDIVLGDPKSSARHARILFDGTVVEIEDLKSTNGTALDGRRVERTRWMPGQRLVIGQSSLWLEEVRPVALAGGTDKMLAVDAGHLNVATRASALSDNESNEEVSLHSIPKRRSILPRAALAGAVVAVAATTIALQPWKGSVAEVESARTDAPQDITVLTAPREASLQYVWYREGADHKKEGGTSEALIRIAPNASGKVSVGVQEQFAGGSGDNWRMALWMAAFNASRIAGKSLTDYEFTLVTRGHVDGPSAGMLTTATLLALMRNKPIRKDTTLTGTINPDGTAGPVGGVEEKMRGAKQAGLTRFGFPLAAVPPENSEEKQVDLFALGKELQLEVREVHDIASAYEFLTDDKFDQGKPCDPEDLQLPILAADALKTSLAAWRTKADAALKDLRNASYTHYLPRTMTRAMVTEVEDALQRAQKHDQAGQLAAAYDAYAGVVANARVSETLINGIVKVAYGDYAGLKKLVTREEPVVQAVADLEKHIQSQAKNETLGMQLSTAFAYSYYVSALSAIEVAGHMREGALEVVEGCLTRTHCPAKDETKARLMAGAVMPDFYYRIAGVFVDMANDLKEFPSDTTVAGPIEPAKLAKLLESYASASGAVLETLDVTMTSMAEEATRGAVTKDQVRGVIAQVEPFYLLARQASHIAGGSEKFAQAPTVMRLAAAETAYVQGASMLNRWYALQSERTQDGQLKVNNAKALELQLSLAKMNARRAAERAHEKAGYIPTAARYAYQLAEAQLDGTDTERMTALAEYWNSSFWSELAASQAGQASGTRPSGAVQ